MFPQDNAQGTQGNPNLQNYWDWMLPKYEQSSQLQFQYSNEGVTVI